MLCMHQALLSIVSKTQNSCPHVTYNPVERGQIMLGTDLNYGENLE